MKEAVKFLLEHAGAGLFLDPGLRKTSITLAAVKILKKEGLFTRGLIIAPLRVCKSVWPAEGQKWADFRELKMTFLHGTKKDQLLRDAKDDDLLLINPEGLQWLFGVKKEEVRGRDGVVRKVVTVDMKRIRSLSLDTLIIDEASKFKRHSSDRFKILKPALDLFARRWALTGSPASNGLLDLFGLMYIIDGGRALGQYISHYRSAYFTPTGYGGYTWVPQHGAAERIYERIAPSVLRMADKDYLKLPEFVSNVIEVELDDKTRKLYDDLEEEFIATLDKGVVVAHNAGAMTIKCCQVANGGIFLNQEVDNQGRNIGPRKWKDLHDAKTEAVLDLLDELNGQPALVTYDFEHDLARLKKALGKDTPHIGGGVSDKKSDVILDKWNRGEIPVLLVHHAAVAYGLNMQGASACHIIGHSLTYDYDHYVQLIARLRRSGSEALRVFFHHIVAKDTVDEAKMISLRRKKKGQDGLFEALQEYAAAARRRVRGSRSKKA